MNVNDTISRYRIVGPVGKGGMGVVYEAEDTRLNRPVALKFLPPDSFSEADKLRFLNEARAAAAARHPNICPVYDVEDVDGKIFIAMALLDGQTLAARLARGALPVREAIGIALQIASGLEAAHNQGIVHRDIKSANIMLGSSGHVSIMDFGLALRPDTTRVTIAGTTVGTPAYMSPEQALGQPVDRRTDIWSLGIVLYEMVGGMLPFRREHATSVLHAIIHDPLPPLTGVAPALRQILEKALAKAPADRFQLATEFIAALKRAQIPESPVTETLTSAIPSATYTIAKPPRRTIRTITIAAGIVCVTMVAGFGIYRYGESRRLAPSGSASLNSLPEQKQVAVLPFEVIGDAETTRTVSDGLVEILASALSDVERFHGKITSVPSSEIRRRKIASAEDARKQYGVNLVITGSAQPAGSGIEFTISLVDTAKVRQLSSSHFIYDPASPLISRDQAVDVLVRLLQFDITPNERKVINAGDTSAPSAFSAYLEGRGLLARFEIAGNVDKAIAAFQRALKSDPDYALAYAGLAGAYWRKTLNTGDKASSLQAIRNAERAVKLGGALAPTHAVLGEIYGGSGHEEDAIRELRTAMELAPSNSDAPRQLARIYTNMGRFAEAEALYKQAIDLRPTDSAAHLSAGIFYYQRERFAEAEAELKQAQNLTPDNDLLYRSLGGIYVMQGRYGDSVEQYQRALKISPNAAGWSSLALAYYFEHRYKEAVTAAEMSLDLDSSGYRSWGNLGAYYKWSAGQENKAAPALRKAIELATKFLATTPKNYDVRANLAEYKARLGDVKGAQAEMDAIPPAARKSLAARLALACELTGQRAKALELAKTYLTSSASLTQIQNDPDLAALWKDPQMQQIVRQRQ